MTPHTPGPWKVSRRFDIYQDLGPNVGGTFIGSTRGNGELPESIARVDEANAKLIAAAPDLLAALLEIRGVLCRKHSPFVVDMEYSYVNQAIKKATTLTVEG